MKRKDFNAIAACLSDDECIGDQEYTYCGFSPGGDLS
jgi:hypothetical protein